MTRAAAALGLALLIAAPARGQSPSVEEELRAEIARLRASLARAEALLDRLEGRLAAPPQPADASEPPSAAEPADEGFRPPPRHPALNTPPRLPPSSAEAFRKQPPRVDVLLQSRFDHVAGAATPGTFFLRKAEIGLKGHIASHVDFSLEIDPVRPADPYRRTYIRLSHIDRLHVKLGLEKAPIGLEELTSTIQVPFVDRSEVTDRFAAAEEMGLFLESTWDRVLLQASVTNGGRRLLRDDNRHKDLTARAVWAAHERLSLGVATLHGRAGPEARERRRYNVEVRYGSGSLRGAQAEYYWAKDAGVRSHAAYAAAYWAAPVTAGWLTHVQPMARYEHIATDALDPVRDLRLLTSGVALLFQEHQAKLQINWLADLRQDRPHRHALRSQYTVEF